MYDAYIFVGLRVNVPFAPLLTQPYFSSLPILLQILLKEKRYFGNSHTG